jgi:hypothetical protein
MPWLFEAKQALTVGVRAPLSTQRDRPPSLAHLERPGNEGRYGPVGESSGWVETRTSHVGIDTIPGKRGRVPFTTCTSRGNL